MAVEEIECEECGGMGDVEQWEDHHPECDGSQCEKYDCPYTYATDCDECDGAGYITSDNPDWWLAESPPE
jgi:hypothetical protein